MTITNGYATLANVKLELAPSGSSFSTGEDTKLEAAINAASRQIDGYCGRRFWVDGSVVDRDFHPDNSRVCYVDDISTTTGLVVKVDSADNGFVSGTTTLTIVTDFILEPANAADEVPVRPYTRIVTTSGAAAVFPTSSERPGVRVTAKFGWPAVPDNVTKACLIQSVMLYKSADAAFGSVQWGEGFATRLRDVMHPLAAALLEPFVRLG